MIDKKDSFIVRKKYWNQIQRLTANQKVEFMACMFSYQNEWSYESEDGAVCMLLDIMIDERQNDEERYLEVCERNKENGKLGWRPPKNQKNPVGLEKPKKADNDSDSDIKEKEISKDISKKKEIPTPSELVEAYKNTPQLVEKIKDEWVVKQRAEYKQKKKSKAYKTISWFIQQLVENVTTVSNWEIRYDVWERLRYAQNKAIDWDNLWIRRDERMERWFATWKKFNSLTQKQNE